MVVGDDSVLVRTGIVAMLGESDAIDVVGTEGDLDALRDLIERTLPDVVLTDIRMPPTGTDEGLQLAAELGERHPEIGVLILSQHAQLAYARTLFEGGNPRRAYVLKDRVTEPAWLLDVVRAVDQARPSLDPVVVGLLLNPESDADPLARLTPREREVLALVAAGASNAAIAEQLTLTLRAIERHMNGIFARLDLPGDGDHNRRVLAALVYLRSSGV